MFAKLHEVDFAFAPDVVRQEVCDLNRPWKAQGEFLDYVTSLKYTDVKTALRKRPSPWNLRRLPNTVRTVAVQQQLLLQSATTLNGRRYKHH